MRKKPFTVVGGGKLFGISLHWRPVLARMSVLTSAIPELGFVRVSVQRAAGRVIPEMASQVLARMIQALGTKHVFIPDDQRAIYPWTQWCQGVGRTTEAHLLALASSQGAVLATPVRLPPASSCFHL